MALTGADGVLVDEMGYLRRHGVNGSPVSDPGKRLLPEGEVVFSSYRVYGLWVAYEKSIETLDSCEFPPAVGVDWGRGLQQGSGSSFQQGGGQVASTRNSLKIPRSGFSQ